MAGDLMIRGAHVVDGTGAAAYTADVEVRDGRIARMGRLGRAARCEEIDAAGLVLTPGFVDIHTHYDAQLFFEPTASPSSWHGVTTVITGNCGFSFAPAAPDDLDWLLLMLSKVEGMSAASLADGVDFAGGSFGDFLDGLEGRIAVNAAAYVGHAAVRRAAMGDDASARAASDAEIDAMRSMVRRAMREGAFGFSTSQLAVHADHEGRPVPPNLAGPDELVALASVLGEFREGVLQFAPRSSGRSYSDEDRDLILAMARASGGKPVNLSILLARPGAAADCFAVLEYVEAAADEGLRLHPMVSVNPKGLHFTFADTFVFDEMPTFREVMGLGLDERAARLRDPATRDRMRRDWSDPTGRALVYGWDATRVAGVSRPEHARHVGRTVADVATEAGADPLDFVVDLALDEDLATVFVFDPPEQADDVLSSLIAHPLLMPGSSDGGAHLNSFCGADYPTRMLTECVARGLVGFEAAVAKLTSVPAVVHGFHDRGVVREGAIADLVLLDRDRLGVEPIRAARDLPAGQARLVWGQRGYVATIVAGEVIVADGEPTGRNPGTVLRPNR